MSLSILFFGTAPFSVPLIEALVADPRFLIVGVVTQPDRAVGRKGTLSAPATKTAAEHHHIPVFQFENIKETSAIETLRALKADLFVVASFGQIIPQTLLDAAPRGAINFHWSLLPRYRGASPIQAALIEGDAHTGATVMLMDAKMDHGPILSQYTEPILPEDTANDLYHRIGIHGAPLLVQTIMGFIEGQILPVHQIHEQATFVALLTREDGRLDPIAHTALELLRCLRAYHPWPGTFLPCNEGRLKILAATEGASTLLSPGIYFVIDGIPAIACRDATSLLLTRVQPEGKPAMDGASFLRGRQNWHTHTILPT